MCQSVPSEMTVLQEYWDASDTVADPSIVPDVEPMVTAFAPLFNLLIVIGCCPFLLYALGNVTVNAPLVALARITLSSESALYAAVTVIAYHGSHPGITSNDLSPASAHAPTLVETSSWLSFVIMA